MKILFTFYVAFFAHLFVMGAASLADCNKIMCQRSMRPVCGRVGRKLVTYPSKCVFRHDTCILIETKKVKHAKLVKNGPCYPTNYQPW
ncbi:hypothetical protein GE061_015548 [Apolygus lucorum]|uniref:Kazal-like domain-containing protein n=1 Tax=Apolygus lucorum TaxID=248454 RepID=A0A8S9XNJ3_APOLU|nr:hypothetical protein GE061_015548 [Apolygus lucorum]